MATISSLVVSLKANSAQLVSELAKSNKKVSSWAASVRSKVNSLTKVFAASAVAAGGAIIAIVNGQAAEIDKLAKKAATLKIDTSDLQKLRYQAALSGVSTDSLDKSLTKMLKTVSDAKNGLSTATRALDQLGLSADTLSTMSTDQQMYTIAEAMGSIESQADRTRIAMDIFGRSGADLLNLFASDLDKVGEEFDQLGAGITKQQAAMVEAYSDAKDKLGQVLEGFSNQLTVQLAPAFQVMVDYISQSVIEFGGLGKVAASVVGGIATGVGFVADVFYGLTLVIKSIQVVFGTAAKYMNKWFDLIYDKYAKLQEFLDKDFKRSDFFSGMSDAFEYETNKISTELDKMLTKGRPSLEIDARIAKIQSEAAAAGKVANEAGIKATNKNTTAIEALSGSIKTPDKTSSVGSSSAWEKVFGKQDDAANENLIISRQFADYAKALNASINRGDQNDIAYFLEQTQRVINASAGRLNGPGNFGADRSHDIEGMQSILDRLVDKMNQETEQVGSIEINVAGDSKTISGKLMGDPAFLKQLKSLIDNNTNSVSKAVAN